MMRIEVLSAGVFAGVIGWILNLRRKGGLDIMKRGDNELALAISFALIIGIT